MVIAFINCIGTNLGRTKRAERERAFMFGRLNVLFKICVFEEEGNAGWLVGLKKERGRKPSVAKSSVKIVSDA